MKKMEEPGKKGADGPPVKMGAERPLDESLANQNGNAFSRAIVAALEKRGIRAKISKNGPMGYFISSGKGRASISDMFFEDENGEPQLGAQINADSLRLAWFREGLKGALRCATDDELYAMLASGRFFILPWSGKYGIRVDGEIHLDGKILGKLAIAKKKYGINAIRYEERFAEEFARRLPKGFGIVSSDSPQLVALDGDAMRSIVERDEKYKNAVNAVRESANAVLAWKS